MIHLPKKDFNNPPIALTKKSACNILRAATAARNGDLCTKYYYGNRTVINLLRAYSVHKDFLHANESAKCYYCESKVEHGVTLQVEHFRPKAKVESTDNNGVEHPGYFWLGLEWSNLLLSCPKCNGKGAKGNRFPIRGVRAIPIHPVDAVGKLNRAECFIHQNPLLAEEALLLNPEVDHPEEYLTFNANGYILSYGTDTIRGDVSIETYRLNRDLLVAARIDVVNRFMKKINIDIAAHMIGRINEEILMYNFRNIICEMMTRLAPSEEFTLWGLHFNREIESCVIGHLTEPYNDMFRTAHVQVTEG